MHTMSRQRRRIGVTLAKGTLKSSQVHQVCSISLTRVLAGIPLGRVFPRRNGESRIGLPVFEDLGVDARSRTGSPGVHTV